MEASHKREQEAARREKGQSHRKIEQCTRQASSSSQMTTNLIHKSL